MNEPDPGVGPVAGDICVPVQLPGPGIEAPKPGANVSSIGAACHPARRSAGPPGTINNVKEPGGSDSRVNHEQTFRKSRKSRPRGVRKSLFGVRKVLKFGLRGVRKIADGPLWVDGLRRRSRRVCSGNVPSCLLSR